MHTLEQRAELLKEFAAEYINQTSNRQSLITVTNATISKDGKRATMYVTVLPENLEDNALHFLKRQRKEFHAYVKSKAHMKRIPFFDFALDTGEKNRQEIDALEYREEKKNGRNE